MDARDPVPTVTIPVTVGKRTIMVPLTTPQECADLIARVCAARKMIDAAAAALAEWNRAEPVDCEITDDEAALCRAMYPDPAAPYVCTLDAHDGPHHIARDHLGALCVEWDGEPDPEVAAPLLTPAGLAVLDDDDDVVEAEVYCGAMSPWGEECTLEEHPGTSHVDTQDREWDNEPAPGVPVTYLACGDQLHDQGAALLAVGAVAWCPTHGNTEVISADEHTATVVTVPGPHPDASAASHGYAPDESGGVLFGPFDRRTALALVPGAGQ